jgi:hypothetical protein
MNVEIGAEAALFPEKEYINGIAVAVRTLQRCTILKTAKDLPSIHDTNSLLKFKFYPPNQEGL